MNVLEPVLNVIYYIKHSPATYALVLSMLMAKANEKVYE